MKGFSQTKMKGEKFLTKKKEIKTTKGKLFSEGERKRFHRKGEKERVKREEDTPSFSAAAALVLTAVLALRHCAARLPRACSRGLRGGAGVQARRHRRPPGAPSSCWSAGYSQVGLSNSVP